MYLHIKAMKNFILPTITIISVIANILFLFFYYKTTYKADSQNQQDETVYRKECAQEFIRKKITNNLYIPESYDPVSLKVDSVFHGALTDTYCVQAALELIDLKNQLPVAENKYKEALHDLKIFGSSGVFWRHAENKKNAEEKLKKIKERIGKREEIIKNRDLSNDGKFIGWAITHRYRSKNRKGEIFINDVVYVVNPEITEAWFQYSLDDNDNSNLEAINKVIKQTLGTYIEE
jgi:hypothetical protein